MFYLFQLGTIMSTFTCIYFVDLLFLLILYSFNTTSPYLEQIFLLTFSILSIISFFFFILSNKIRKKENLKQSTFHPTSTFRQRIMFVEFIILSCICILSLIFSFIFSNYARLCFVITNCFFIIGIILAFIYSILFESLPDKNDTIYFDDNFIYYYMRVKKGIKNNQYMNSYIIPYTAINRSYIYNNKLFIEINKNHPDFIALRQFSTNSKRIIIKFSDYPELKKFITQKNISNKISLKKISNITHSNYL